MTTARAIKAVPLLIFLVGALLAAQAQETKIERSQLPPAVQKAVAKNSQGATIRGFAQEKEHGKTYYEAEMILNGLSKDVTLFANGDVVEVEQQVPVESLPASVKNALQTKAGQGKIMKVESLTKHGQLVAYEAQIRTSGKQWEIQVGPQGQPLSHEE
jgi:hypothetical protein